MKPRPPEFDLVETPIERGITLLEASAGTGKTYTLSGVVLRLLLETPPGAEGPLAIEQVLVVTFTDAATAELRDRIRGSIARALTALESNQTKDDLLRRWLVEWPEGSPARGLAIRRLETALRNFDLAAIFTIHSFSQRLLRDRAFESGALFDVELVTDQGDLIQGAADDFWRQSFGNGSPLVIALAGCGKITSSSLAKLVTNTLRMPDLQIVTGAGEQAAGEILGEFENAFTRAKLLWESERETLRAQFGSSVKWPKGPFAKDEEMNRRFAAVDRICVGEIAAHELPSLLEFAQSNLDEHKHGNRKKEVVPVHQFFAECETMADRAARWAVALKRDAVRAIRERLGDDKAARKVQSFDDLLTRVRDVLRSDAGPALVREVRRTFGAALIDEFQDTDPVQWEIFRTLFAGTPPVPEPFLFLIGDPKQSIYGFRGADIYTYLAAAETAKARRYTLGKNWRSERPLVHAVNAVFDQHPDAFVLPGIDFLPVTPSDRAEQTPLQFDGERPAPLVLWWLGRTSGKKPIDKGRARVAIVKAVAAEVLRLLAGLGRVEGRKLEPRQIAVLVRNHTEASDIYAALREVGIPGVRLTREGVFESDEAMELFRVLAALANPGDEGLLRAAAATGWLGGFVALQDGPETGSGQLATLREQMREWLSCWETRGFAVCFRRLLAESGARARLLRRPDGERALTNLLHIGQLLHEAAAAEGLGVGALQRWFATRLDEDRAVGDEHLLRLERDDEAVRILTMHRCKGLEFEIVFCPFCYDGIRTDKIDPEKGIEVHDVVTQQRILDLGPGWEGDQLARRQREEAAENARLFYVALTRAIRRCYVAWGAIKDAETSAPAWLLHRRQLPVDASVVDDPATWKADFEGRSDEELRGDVLALAQRAESGAGPAITVEDLPVEPGPTLPPQIMAMETPVVREFRRELRDDWRLLAFSSMTTGAESVTPDYDAGTASEIPLTAPAGMFAFPGGTRAGTCLHRIFERLDFKGADPETLAALIPAELRGHGIAPEDHAPAVEAMIGQVLDTPLAGLGGPFRLADIASVDRVNELEFHCPLREVRASDVANVLRQHGRELPGQGLAERIEELQFHAAGGLLTGFMDLVVRRGEVFYLLDWKSNWLGNAYSDYEPARLATAMTARRYPLQYLLYTMALDRWLRTRLGAGYRYEKNFGGVFYLFLRGVNVQHPGAGIFADRPSQALIEDLGATLLAERRGKL